MKTKTTSFLLKRDKYFTSFSRSFSMFALLKYSFELNVSFK